METKREVEFLSIEQLKEPIQLKTEIVDIPEKKGKVRIKALVGSERSEIMDLCQKPNGEPDANMMQGLFIAYGICKEDGSRVFNWLKDKEIIMNWPVGLLDRLSSKIMTLSGLNSTAQEKKMS